MKNILGITLILIYASVSFAQESDTAIPSVRLNIFEELGQNRTHNGYVNIKGAPEINALVQLHTTINKNQQYISGFRIQIFSGSSYDHPIEDLQLFKENFEKDFPNIPAYLNYIDPDFKIRVGNFRNRLDCIPTLKRIRRRYPSCYAVKTEIPKSDLDKLSTTLSKEENE